MRLIPAGHQLGLVLTLSDAEFVSSHSTGATVTVDLTASSLALPIAPVGALTFTAVPNAIYAPESDPAVGTRFN